MNLKGEDVVQYCAWGKNKLSTSGEKTDYYSCAYAAFCPTRKKITVCPISEATTGENLQKDLGNICERASTLNASLT